MGEHPTWDGADGRSRPDGLRGTRPSGEAAGATRVTVDELLARQGGSVGRRAARRAEQLSATAPHRRSGLPAAPRPQAGLPPVPGAAAAPSRPRGDAGDGIRRSGPLPPLPGRAPLPVDDGVRRSTPVPPLPSRVAPPPGRLQALRAGPAAQLAGRAARQAAATPARRRVVRVVVALVVVLGLAALYPLGLYFYVDRSMDRVDALATDGPEVLAPQLQAGRQNYLVVGTGVPGETGPASVVSLLVSVAPDGSRAVLLTVASNALVDTPQCRADDGRVRDPRTEALASALLDGGPSCLVRAVQEVSGLRIDHYLDLDLSRLPGIVDALGGVSVCVRPSPAVTAASRPLPSGSSRLTGREAAAYLRPADPAADQIGAAVAQRAQLLLTATLHAAISVSTLTDPGTLTRFLHRAAGALTVDDGTTLGDLRSLGSSLGGLPDGAVQRAELPVSQVGYVPAGGKQPYVLLDAGRTRSLFDAVIGGTRVPAGMTEGGGQDGPGAASGVLADGSASAAATPSASPRSAAATTPAKKPLTVAPDRITVDVLNGTATTGLAAKAAAALEERGFGVGTVGNAAAPVGRTVVRYGPGAAERARTVAAAVRGSVLKADPAAGPTVQVVVGPNWSTVVAVHTGPPAPVRASATSPAATAAAPRIAAPAASQHPATAGC